MACVALSSLCVASAVLAQPEGPPGRFDVRDTLHEIRGFGVTYWCGAPMADLERIFRELNIRFGRTPRGFYRDGPDRAGFDEYFGGYDDWERTKERWALAERCGVTMTLTGWNFPNNWITAVNQSIADHGDEFATMWASLAASYADRGMRPRYILFGEESECPGTLESPMYIAPGLYSDLLKRTRKALDASGLEDVGIIAPGCAHLDWQDWKVEANPWIAALDDEAVSYIDAWATHGYLFSGRGSRLLWDSWPFLTRAIEAKEPERGLPIFVTESESLTEAEFGTVEWSVQQFQDTLVHLNSGAAGTWHFSACGTIGANPLIKDGDPTLAFHCLRTLFPKVSVGSRVLRAPPPEEGEVYAAAFVDGDAITLAMSNVAAVDRVKAVLLAGISELAITEALAFIGEDGREVVEPEIACEPLDDGVLLRANLPPMTTLTVVGRWQPQH